MQASLNKQKWIIFLTVGLFSDCLESISCAPLELSYWLTKFWIHNTEPKSLQITLINPKLEYKLRTFWILKDSENQSFYFSKKKKNVSSANSKLTLKEVKVCFFTPQSHELVGLFTTIVTSPGFYRFALWSSGRLSSVSKITVKQSQDQNSNFLTAASLLFSPLFFS